MTRHQPKQSRLQKAKKSFGKGGSLRPFRLLKQDASNMPKRYLSDWTVFNQLIFASAIYVFFTNLLPGITFASDLYVLTGKSWGTIEVVFSTGLCGVIFSLFSIQPLTILGVTGPFSVLAENIYSFVKTVFISISSHSWPGLSFTLGGCMFSSQSLTPTTGPCVT